MWSVVFGATDRRLASTNRDENKYRMKTTQYSQQPVLLSLVVLAGMVAVMLAGCGGAGDAVPPPAAKVDGVTISQAGLVAAVPGGSPAQRKAQLDTSIAEQLLANAATKAKLDADPGVMAAMETSKRQILARAYLAKQAAAQPKVTDVDIKAFYDEHPELFAKRKIYRLQEIAITVAGDRMGDITKKFQGMKTFGERAVWLKKNGITFTTGVVVKGAEEWPADLLARLTKMKDGTAFDLANAKGFSSLQLTGIEEQPLTPQQAQSQIAKFISNQRLGELVNQETKRLRESAKIEYFAPYSVK